MATSRVRGFAEWSPRGGTRVVIDQVKEILVEYEEFLPMTIRQIFYRLVGNYDYEKTDQAYERLIEYLNRARRAGIIPFDSIRDDGFTRSGWVGYESVDEFRDALRYRVEAYKINRQIGQSRHTVIWAEASGMVPMLTRVADEYSVPVYSSGGFDSTTVKHDLAQEFVEHGDVLVLHVGDHDPSGVHMFSSLFEDIVAFAQTDRIAFHRLAVTPEQIVEHNLPTKPVKAGNRMRFEGETVQAEALPPDVLLDIVRQAIESEFDLSALESVKETEAAQREELITWLDRLQGEAP